MNFQKFNKKFLSRMITFILINAIFLFSVALTNAADIMAKSQQDCLSPAVSVNNQNFNSSFERYYSLKQINLLNVNTYDFKDNNTQNPGSIKNNFYTFFDNVQKNIWVKLNNFLNSEILWAFVIASYIMILGPMTSIKIGLLIAVVVFFGTFFSMLIFNPLLSIKQKSAVFLSLGYVFCIISFGVSKSIKPASYITAITDLYSMWEAMNANDSLDISDTISEIQQSYDHLDSSPSSCFIDTSRIAVFSSVVSIPVKTNKLQSFYDSAEKQAQAQFLLDQLIKSFNTLNHGQISDYESEAIWEETAKALTALGTPGQEALILALDNPLFQVRGFAAYSLGLMRSKQAVGALINALADQDWHVRKLAVEALGIIDDPRTVTALINHLYENDNNEVYAEIHYALRSKGTIITPYLIQALEKEPNLGIIYLLDDLADQRALGILKKLYIKSGKTELMGLAALRAYQKIINFNVKSDHGYYSRYAQTESELPLSPVSARLLEKLMGSESMQQSKIILRAILAQGDESLRTLIRGLDSESMHVREMSLLGLIDLAKADNDAENSLFFDLFYNIWMNETEMILKKHAYNALIKMGPGVFNDLMQKFRDNPDQDLLLLLYGFRNFKIVDPLIKLVENSQQKSDLKLLAVSILGDLGGQDAVEPLEKMLQNKTEPGVYIIKKALAKLKWRIRESKIRSAQKMDNESIFKDKRSQSIKHSQKFIADIRFLDRSI